jgi:hypothetical protein
LGRVGGVERREMRMSVSWRGVSSSKVKVEFRGGGLWL